MYKTTLIIVTALAALVFAQSPETTENVPDKPVVENPVNKPELPGIDIPKLDGELPPEAVENIAAMKEKLAKVEEMLNNLPSEEREAMVEQLEAEAEAAKNRVIDQLPEEAKEKVQEALAEIEKNIEDRRAEFEEELTVE